MMCDMSSQPRSECSNVHYHWCKCQIKQILIQTVLAELLMKWIDFSLRFVSDTLCLIWHTAVFSMGLGSVSWAIGWIAFGKKDSSSLSCAVPSHFLFYAASQTPESQCQAQLRPCNWLICGYGWQWLRRSFTNVPVFIQIRLKFTELFVGQGLKIKRPPASHDTFMVKQLQSLVKTKRVTLCNLMLTMRPL